MKHGIVQFALVAALALILVPSLALAAEQSSKTFSVSPGQLLETAQFGFGSGAIQPYIGLDLLRGSIKEEESAGGDDYEMSGSAMIVAPHIGARWYFGTNSVRPYFVGDLVKSFGFFDIKEEVNGEDQIGDAADELKDAVKSALGFWGVGVGFGCEYAFADNFGVGGEYRFTWLHTSTGDIDMGGGDTMKISGDIDMTASRVWLNYRF